MVKGVFSLHKCFDYQPGMKIDKFLSSTGGSNKPSKHIDFFFPAKLSFCPTAAQPSGRVLSTIVESG